MFPGFPDENYGDLNHSIGKNFAELRKHLGVSELCAGKNIEFMSENNRKSHQRARIQLKKYQVYTSPYEVPVNIHAS